MTTQLATVVAPTAGLGIALLLCLAVVCRLLDDAREDREAADVRRIKGGLAEPAPRVITLAEWMAGHSEDLAAVRVYIGRAKVPGAHRALEAVSR